LAWGYSYVKTTQTVEDPANPGEFIEEEVELKIPIKSVGVAEVTDRIARRTPVPPTSKRYIKPGDEEYKLLGLKTPKIVEEENYADPDFKEEIRKHTQRTVYASILAGLAMDIVDENEALVLKCNGHNKATDIIDEDKAIAILKSQGLSNAQFDQLYEDIQHLTTKEKERVDLE
jgi:hypothetical protein